MSRAKTKNKKIKKKGRKKKKKKNFESPIGFEPMTSPILVGAATTEQWTIFGKLGHLLDSYVTHFLNSAGISNVDNASCF